MSLPGWVPHVGRFKVTRHSWGRTGYAYKGYKPRLVLHTTETVGLPSYVSGANQPHLTIRLVGGGLTIWQHQPLNVGARALLGTSTNTANCIQVEQCMYSDEKLARSVNGVWVGDLAASQLKTLGEFYKALCDLCGIPSTFKGGARMSQSTWLSRSGWGVTDHARVPQNSHWDCGVLDIAGALAKVGSDVGKGTAKPPKKPTKPKAPVKLKVDGVLGIESTKELQHQLGTNADGWIDGQNSAWKPKLYAWPRVRYDAKHSGSPCVEALQKKIGVTADRLLGPDTISELQRWLNRRGFNLAADGVLGPQTAKDIQTALNDGKFK